MARYHNSYRLGNSSHKALAQLLFLLLIHFFGHSNNHKMTALGITGASFFALGLTVCISALFFLDPISIPIILIASTGGASMAAGLVFGITNIITNKIDTRCNNGKTALGVAGASFFTVGLITLACALLLIDPLAITIITSLGAGSLGFGTLAGGTRMIIGAVDHFKRKRIQSNQINREKHNEQPSKNDEGHSNVDNVPIRQPAEKKSADFAVNQKKKIISDDGLSASSGNSSPRLFKTVNNIINLPVVDPEVYYNPPKYKIHEGTAPPLNILENVG